MLGRGDGGLRGIGVSGSGYNEVLALEVLNVIVCVERKRRAKLPCLHQLLAQSLPRSRSKRAGVRAYVHFVCVCVYMRMCVCVRTCMHV